MVPVYMHLDLMVTACPAAKEEVTVLKEALPMSAWETQTWGMLVEEAVGEVQQLAMPDRLHVLQLAWQDLTGH